MTHKQVKFGKGKRSRKVKQVEEEYEKGIGSRRLVLLSCDDVDRMAVESSRARLISHLVNPDEHSQREFTSYYRGPTRYIDPRYSITSHTNNTTRVSIPKIPQIIPAYPSIIQTPSWCPYPGPPSSQNSETDLDMEKTFNCKCGNCTTRTCPAKFDCSTLKPYGFKNNIMTFCDQCTMTRNMNDTACGRASIPSTPKCSDVFVPCSTSMVAIKDPHQIHEMYSRNCSPIPILKKGCNGPMFYDCDSKRVLSDHCQDEIVRDIEPCRSKSFKCFFRQDKDSRSDCENEVVSRKNIYNEGISDVIANKFPKCPMRAPTSPICSRTSMSSKCYESDCDNCIPHSHRGESKYHRHCKRTPHRQYIREEDFDPQKHVLVPSTSIVSKTYTSRPCIRCKQQPRCIRLPKKLLTSERVIETCNKHPDAYMPCRR